VSGKSMASEHSSCSVERNSSLKKNYPNVSNAFGRAGFISLKTRVLWISLPRLFANYAFWRRQKAMPRHMFFTTTRCFETMR
jgi:hypothetical protein